MLCTSVQYLCSSILQKQSTILNCRKTKSKACKESKRMSEFERCPRSRFAQAAEQGERFNLPGLAAHQSDGPKLHHIKGVAKAVELTLTTEETFYMKELYVPHRLVGEMAQNTPAAVKEQHVWSTGNQTIQENCCKIGKLLGN